jgi:hypothetical protein
MHAHVIISQAEGVDDDAVTEAIHEDYSDASGSAHSDLHATAAARQWFVALNIYIYIYDNAISICYISSWICSSTILLQ